MAYQVIDLTGVSSGSDMEPVDDVAVVPAPPAAKLKAKVKKPKAKEVSASSGSQKPTYVQTSRNKTKKKYLAADVPWGRIVALKNCKAVTRGRQWDLTENDRKLTQIGRNHASHVQFLDLTISGLHLELHPQVGSDGVLKKVEMIDDGVE